MAYGDYGFGYSRGPQNRGIIWGNYGNRTGRYPTFPTAKPTRTLAAPATPAQAAATTTGPAAPPGFGDILSQLLSGLGGGGGGITPEEGLADARRALIQYGQAPSGLDHLSNLGGAFDSATQALANANTQSGISILARINQAHADQQRYIKNVLAAHGTLESGETGFRLGREQTGYAQAQADSTSKLLDYLSGINSGISSYLQQQAYLDALRRALSGGGGSDGGGGENVTLNRNDPAYRALYNPGNDYGQSWSDGQSYDYLGRPRGDRNYYL